MNFRSLLLPALFIFSAVAASAQQTAGLTLAQAKQLGAGARQCAEKNGWKISIAVVNAEGGLLYFERTDNAFSGSAEAAIEKARSASLWRRPTRVFAENVKNGRNGLPSMKSVVAIEGGVPVQLGAEHAGAIGISGAHTAEDDQCAQAAADALTKATQLP